MSNLHVVILAGGAGSRLWPHSRASLPKQFLPLINEQSMLQNTVKRVEDLAKNSVKVICNEDHRFLVQDQMKQINQVAQILLEPCPRGTAPAVGLAASMSCPDDLLLVLSSDHYIEDSTKFRKSVDDAIDIAKSGKLVVFGVNPASPNTGYGYVMAGSAIGGAFEVERFIEKPDLETAQKLISAGGWFWNSGIFLFRSDVYLEELKRFRPKIFSNLEHCVSGLLIDSDFYRFDEVAFEQCIEDSIDYAVMENTESAVLFPMNNTWE